MKGKDLQKLKVIMKNKLASNSVWAVKGMIRIFQYQTTEEQSCEVTVEDNGIGFNGVDANIMTSFSKQVNSGRNLSPKQMAIVFKKMPKYWGQLSTLIPENVKQEMIAEKELV